MWVVSAMFVVMASTSGSLSNCDARAQIMWGELEQVVASGWERRLVEGAYSIAVVAREECDGHSREGEVELAHAGLAAWLGVEEAADTARYGIVLCALGLVLVGLLIMHTGRGINS